MLDEIIDARVDLNFGELFSSLHCLAASQLASSRHTDSSEQGLHMMVMEIVSGQELMAGGTFAGLILLDMAHCKNKRTLKWMKTMSLSHGLLLHGLL